MFGPGFVWLVRANAPNSVPVLRILSTYNAGSPYPNAHFRRQGVDMNTQSVSGYANSDYAKQNTAQNTVGMMGQYSNQSKQQTAPGGIHLVPLLCVNTWEHVWLRDWGIAGKRQYLEAWWDRIDWNIVQEHAGVMTQDGGSRNFLRR
jgi:superoxide dismutase, Fe-Mn family